MKLGILFGGNSLEHEISIVSAFSLKKQLNDNALMIYVDYHNNVFDASKMKLEDFKNNRYKKLKRTRFVEHGIKGKMIDCLILACHGENSEDGLFAAISRFYHIPFVGSDILASSIAMNKWESYLLLSGSKVPVLPTIYYNYQDYIDKKIIPWFPCIVKPVYGGSSIGIFICNNEDEFFHKFRWNSTKESKYVIQPYYENIEEYNMAFYENGNSMLEKIENKKTFFSFEEKYIDSFKNYHNKRVDLEEERFSSLGRKVYDLLNCSGIIRIDFFKKDEEIFINEINTIPGSLAMYLFKNKGEVLEACIKKAVLKNEIIYKSNGFLLKSDIQK